MRLVTERLIIRTLEERDEADWLSLFADPAVLRYLPPTDPVTPDRFRTVLERRSALEERCGYAVWAVELRSTGEFIGQCGLYPKEMTGPEVELAYHYQPASWGNGIGTEAAIATLDYGLNRMQLAEVMAVAMPGNTGSWRVMEKAGMTYAGRVTLYGLSDLKKYIATRGAWVTPPNGPPTEVD